MKLILIFLLLLALSGISIAQSSIVKFNPIPLVNSTLSLGFEQKVAQASSLQFSFDYATEKDFGFKSTWLGIGAEYRIYNLIQALSLQGSEAPAGLFVAPTLGIRFFKDVDENNPDPAFDEKYSFVNVGALAGYQWLPRFKNGKSPLALEASVGLLVGFMTKGEKYDYEDYAIWPRFSVGVVPTFNIGIGFAFGK